MERAREIVAAELATDRRVSALAETFSSETIAQVSRRLADDDLARRKGRVRDLIGLIIETSGLSVEMGEICMVGDEREPREGGRGLIPTEVVGFRGGRTLLMPLGELRGIGPGTLVRPTGRPFEPPWATRCSVASSTAWARRWTSMATSWTPHGAAPRPPRPTRSRVRASPSGSGSASARWTRSSRAGAASASASSPARASASPRCWA